MSWSLGEIRALSVKAAKGAGFSWGEAEEAGFAVEWLEARCTPGVEALAQYLSVRGTSLTCPIQLGCQISDMGAWEGYLPTKISQPLLLAPFIAQTLERKNITLDAGEAQILISHMDVYIEGYTPSTFSKATEARLLVEGKIPDESTCKSRVLSDQMPHVKILEKFAHKTYAPATEESRLAGAGAGTTDND